MRSRVRLRSSPSCSATRRSTGGATSMPSTWARSARRSLSSSHPRRTTLATLRRKCAFARHTSWRGCFCTAQSAGARRGSPTDWCVVPQPPEWAPRLTDGCAALQVAHPQSRTSAHRPVRRATGGVHSRGSVELVVCRHGRHEPDWSVQEDAPLVAPLAIASPRGRLPRHGLPALELWHVSRTRMLLAHRVADMQHPVALPTLTPRSRSTEP